VLVGDTVLAVLPMRGDLFHLLDIGSLNILKSFPYDRHIPPSLWKLHQQENCLSIEEAHFRTVVYNLTDFDRLQEDIPYGISSLSTSGSPSGMPYMEGRLEKGILYNDTATAEPRLVVDGGSFSLNPTKTYDVNLRQWLQQVPNIQVNQGSVWELSGTGILVQLQWSIGGGYMGSPKIDTATLFVFDRAGNLLENFVFIKVRTDPMRQRSNANVVVKNQTLHVVYRSTIYLWTYNQAVPQINNTAFHFEPQQDAFRIDPETTILSHRIIGGTPPYAVFQDRVAVCGNCKTNDKYLGIAAVDEATGSVTIDGAKLAQSALNFLVEVGDAKGLAELRQASLRTIEPWSNLPAGEKPAGIPVAFPISLRAVDRKGLDAYLRYFVYSDVPYTTIAPLITKALNDKAISQAGEDSADGAVQAPDHLYTNVTIDPVSVGSEEVAKHLYPIKLLLVALFGLIFILSAFVAVLHRTVRSLQRAAKEAAAKDADDAELESFVKVV